jgi:chorismate mutase-like protein
MEIQQNQISLEELREQIDSVDTLLLSCLARRQAIVNEIAEFKRKENLPVFHPFREITLIERRKQAAGSMGLDVSLVESVFKSILGNSRKAQTGVCRYC